MQYSDYILKFFFPVNAADHSCLTHIVSRTLVVLFSNLFFRFLGIRKKIHVIVELKAMVWWKLRNIQCGPLYVRLKERKPG